MHSQISGPEIRAWRKGKEFSRDQLGVILKVSAATIHNWESGRNKPPAAAAEHLRRLISGEIAVTPTTPREERLMDEIVKRGGYSTREEFLAETLMKLIRSGEAKPS